MHKSFYIFIALLNLLIAARALVISPAKASEISHLNETTNKLPEETYSKAYKIMKNSKAFYNMTFQEAKDFINEIEDWKPPAKMANRFPYYLAGFDYEDRPVWISELGKYQWADLLDGSKEFVAMLEKLVLKVGINVFKSLVRVDAPGKDVRQVVVILDYDGYDMNQLTKLIAHSEVIEFAIKTTDRYLDIVEATFGEVILINSNYAVKLAIDLFRPVMGELMEKLTVLGVNKYKWKAELQRILPEKVIPTWYGGSKDFKPLVVCG